jgi:hypothetical protein
MEVGRSNHQPLFLIAVGKRRKELTFQDSFSLLYSPEGYITPFLGITWGGGP